MEVTINMGKRYTYADYLTWIDEKRRELLNGVVRLMQPAANRRHQGLTQEIYDVLKGYIRKHRGGCKVYFAPFDVRLPKSDEHSDDRIYTVVQPDICVVCDPSKLDERGCIGAPDMVVEVQSPSSEKYDLHKKFMIYQEAGVREYWVVYQNKAVDVFILQADGMYDEGTFYQLPQIVPVQTLPGCEISLKEIFDRV